jgi:hypothetical protein
MVHVCDQESRSWVEKLVEASTVSFIRVKRGLGTPDVL